MASGTPALGLHQVGASREFQSEYITEVLLDRVGLLWIGTREGLFLHDGHRFRRFQYEPGNSASLTSDEVRTLHEDAHGRLWVGTMNGGLSLADRAHWSFQHFRHDASNPESLPHDAIFALEDAEGGRLWVGTRAGLAVLDPATGRATRTPLVPGGGGEFVLALRRDRAGTLWVGTLGRGLFRRRAGESTFEHVATDANSGAAQDIFSLAEDGAGGLWVGAREGLYRMLPGTSSLHPVPLSPPEVASKLFNITELEPDGRGTLWIGSFGAGLFRMDTATGEVHAERLPSDGPGYEQRIDEGTLELDPAGGLFIGTFGMGLFHASLRPDIFQTFRGKGTDGTHGLANEDVWAVLSEGDSHLLVGSFGGGVDRLDVATGQVEPLNVPVPSDEDWKGVLCLLRTRDGALWVGLTQGAYRLEPGTGRLHLYRHAFGQGRDQAPGYVNSLLQDSKGRVWLGSASEGIHLYRPDTDDFLAFRHDAGDPRSLSDDSISTLMEDRRGRLWIGTQSGGLNICTVEADRLDCVRLGPQTTPRLGHFFVSALLEDPEGSVWVGTVGGGLQRLWLDAAGLPARADHWTQDEGLIDNHVMALARAPDGALWAGTRAGLSRLDVATGTFENHGPSDGLPTGTFNRAAVSRLGGRLYWGTAKGVVALEPLVRPRKGPPPPLVITSVEGLESPALPTRPAWELSSLDVPWRQPFTLEFAVLDYGRSDAKYEYRLSAEGAWLPLSTRNHLTFHALPPGEHQLQVRGRSPGQPWSETRPLTLRVAPPFWQRNDVRFGALAGTLLVFIAGLAWRTRFLEQRNQALRELQAEREQALRQAQASREHMRRLNMRLEAAKEEERKHLARELHDEFGQALTAVKLNLGLVAATARPSGPLAGRLPDAISLIDRLIGQVRSLSLDLRPPQLDELGLVAALENYLAGVAQRSAVELVFTSASSLPSLGVERDIVIFRVIQEAITNALRHARARRLEVRLESAGQAIRLEVRDDGRGFAAEEVLAGGAPGSFGLFGMQERVRDLGGRFEVTSRLAEGTRVVAEVPMARDENSMEENHASGADG
ncbi:ligand-binding sensor domain-containing protein [Pyxidicoccus sp. MSG2]|uniref:ligand-binding sensor domain-containing protein n=1 Tax=Pyxidicoccus sp. MSG2 TaxID=2996790 RepID=UPI00227075BD|nr:sensor histidine kinase [Pyxidicoccus sp. MSG2]MCY1021553.1 histidine kinase [Pyxidicoccus sp. MSG2]